MSYSKEMLEKVVAEILGSNPTIALGLPRASEECAVQLFLNADSNSDAAITIRKAVSDIREFGCFKFA